MRYYSVGRPIAPGTFPKVPGNKILEIENFSCRRFIDEIGRMAWGCIEYSNPLSEKVAADYELISTKEA